jgi:hypothetical protein
MPRQSEYTGQQIYELWLEYIKREPSKIEKERIDEFKQNQKYLVERCDKTDPQEIPYPYNIVYYSLITPPLKSNKKNLHIVRNFITELETLVSMIDRAHKAEEERKNIMDKANWDKARNWDPVINKLIRHDEAMNSLIENKNLSFLDVSKININIMKSDIYNRYIQIRIDPNLTAKEISDKVYAFIKAEREKEDFKKAEDYFYRYKIPTPPIFYEELKRYLKVYDLKTQENPKLTNREIGKVVYPKKKWDEQLERSLLTEFNKAKKILKNVKEGFFPGKY